MKQTQFFLSLFLLSLIFLFQNCSTDSAQQSSDNSATTIENSDAKTDASSTTDELTTKGMTPAQATLASLKEIVLLMNLMYLFINFLKLLIRLKR